MALDISITELGQGDQQRARIGISVLDYAFFLPRPALALAIVGIANDPAQIAGVQLCVSIVRTAVERDRRGSLEGRDPKRIAQIDIEVRIPNLTRSLVEPGRACYLAWRRSLMAALSLESSRHATRFLLRPDLSGELRLGMC